MADKSAGTSAKTVSGEDAKTLSRILGVPLSKAGELTINVVDEKSALHGEMVKHGMTGQSVFVTLPLCW